jgi:hypothetical protein
MSRALITSTLLLATLTLATSSARAADKPEAVADAQVQTTVIEDDSTRIEELRVRGQTQKVTIQPKNSKFPAYEIIMGDAGRELSPGASSTRGAAGKSVWRLLNF